MLISFICCIAQIGVDGQEIRVLIWQADGKAQLPNFGLRLPLSNRRGAPLLHGAGSGVIGNTNRLNRDNRSMRPHETMAAITNAYPIHATTTATGYYYAPPLSSSSSSSAVAPSVPSSSPPSFSSMAVAPSSSSSASHQPISLSSTAAAVSSMIPSDDPVSVRDTRSETPVSMTDESSTTVATATTSGTVEKTTEEFTCPECSRTYPYVAILVCTSHASPMLFDDPI